MADGAAPPLEPGPDLSYSSSVCGGAKAPTSANQGRRSATRNGTTPYGSASQREPARAAAAAAG